MLQLLVGLAALVALFPAGALAQQGQRQQQQDLSDIKAACEKEVRQLCIHAVLPIPPFVQRSSVEECIAENQSKLSKQCWTMIQAGREMHEAK
jgi:hypothetical protein